MDAKISPSLVAVLSSDGTLLESVPPAVARYVLKQGSATPVCQDPFTIKLSAGLDSCPRLARSVSGSTPEIIRDGIVPFVGRNLVQNQKFNPAQSMRDVVDFFRLVDRENGGDEIVWAKATAPKGNQVIVECETSNGKRVKIPPIRPGEPVCLSKFATFEVLRNSPDLTQTANNGLIKLMTHAEAEAYYVKRAGTLKADPMELMQKSNARAKAEASARPLDVSSVDKSQKIVQGEYVDESDVINPKILHLCEQVDIRLKDSDDMTAKPNQRRMPVNEFMQEILELEDSLSLDEIEYIRSRGYYPTVKRWATAKQKELFESQGGGPETDALSD